MPLRTLYESPRIRSVASIALLLIVLLMLTANLLPARAHRALNNVANAGLNEADVEMQTRNYYREVSDVDVGRFAGTATFLRQIGLKGPPEREETTAEPAALGRTSIVQQTNPFLPWEFKRNEEIMFLGHPLRINRWGMRDRDYEKQKPASTFRIALVGASNSMGNGVAVEDGYADVLETRLNTTLTSTGHANYEVLNFSVGGYDLTDRLFVATEKAPAFEPDLIIVVMLARDLRAAAHQRVAELMANNVPLHYAFLEQIAQEAGATMGDRQAKIKQRLHPFRGRLIYGCAEELARVSDRNGVPVAVLVLKLLLGPPEQELIDAAEICRDAGLPTLPIFDAYEGHAAENVYLSATDRHPSPLGHTLIAEELLAQLLSHPVLGPMIRGED